MNAPDMLDVAVVGGGQAGLAVAWHLRRRDLHFHVLDAGPETGHVWRSRWDGLRLFTPARYDALPGMPFPGPPDTHPGKDAVADYLRDYATTFDLPVHTDTRVTRLHRSGNAYALVTANRTVHARQVVIATGPFHTPAIPTMAARLDPAVLQLHSADYRNPDGLPPGPVLVVGDGNSGRQIAAELAATRPVDLACSGTATVVPQRLLGRDLFWWLSRTGLVTAAADSRIARRMRARGELLVATTDRMLRGAGVGLCPRVTDAEGGAVRFADGSRLEVGTVLWATGYRPDYSWVDVDGVLVDGRPVHDRGVTPAPGLYVLGLPWLHSRGSALLGFVHHDAGHLAERIAEQAAAARTRRNHRCDTPATPRSLEPSLPPR